MAASGKIFSIKLTEDDVPGAKFRSDHVDEHSVVELKRLLECRALPVHGNKPELVKRCLACIDSNQSDEIVVSVDGGSWYKKKVSQFLTENCQEETEVPILPVTGWGDFPSKPIPEGYTYGSIYDHIIATAVVQRPNGDKTATDFGTTKPMLKGRQFFTSGHVKNIKDNASTDYYFMKSSVMASYQIDKVRNVTLTLKRATAKVVDASCDCEASSMSRCNHVAALLFALEDYTLQHGFKPPSSTSQLCQWNIGRKNKRDPKPCQSASYAKKLKPDRIINHDPRPMNLVEDEETFLNNFIATLPMPSDPLNGKSMFETLIEIKYKEYQVDRDYLENMRDTTIKILQNQCKDAPHQLENTLGQAASSSWKQQRVLRVTASNAKSVASMSTKRGQYNYLKRHMWSNEDLQLRALDYGKKMRYRLSKVIMKCISKVAMYLKNLDFG